MKKMAPLNLNAIASGIYLIRGKKVMLDRDLAVLYGVSTKHLKRQVRRNRNRFPEDFMFELSDEETRIWRRQFGTSNLKDKMGLRYSPFAFTEHGILMLSSVLNSEKAAQINIAIMRVFLRLREMIMTNSALALRLERVDRTVEHHDRKIRDLYRIVTRFSATEKKAKGPIGFQP
ncbi:MAG: ORF6N domain-containing protein [Candidatus Omnitrophota bacterium]